MSKLRHWLEPTGIQVPASFQEAIGGNPLVSRVLFARGLTGAPKARRFMDADAYIPTPAGELPGMELSADILLHAIANHAKIGVWGDFDVDGQTSTSLLVSALRHLGAEVIYHIPVRADESHGIGIEALTRFLQQGIQLLLTCDTGISSLEAISFARQRGIPVIVTDHHDLPPELPEADAIINPKLLPVNHPLSTLPGVGVAYKLVEHLFHKLAAPLNPGNYLDLAALGIVADIALLQRDTRYLLQRGLAALRSSRRVGLLAIMELADVNQANLTEEHISYILAPRMNALGRLDDANSMVELMTTEDVARARILALQLEGMNAQRKLLSNQVYQAALSQLNEDPKLLDYPVLVLSHNRWPAGVIGIVAARLVEQYNRPVILFSTPEGEAARGSARSIDPVNITALIAANQQLVKGFGGHPMAAGLSIDPLNIDAFRLSISRTLAATGFGAQKEKDLQIDGYMSLPELSLAFVEDLERLAPFGAGNPALVLATRELKLTGYAAVGRNDEHLQLTIEDVLGHSQRTIWWQGAGNPLPETPFDLAYSVRASTYRGQAGVQIEWKDYRLVERSSISLASKQKSIEVIDYRHLAQPGERLKEIQQQGEAMIWGEAEVDSVFHFVNRLYASPADTLVIWTTPPGSNEFQEVLSKVNPSRVYLFGTPTKMDDLEHFIKRLLGLIKFSLQNSSGTSSLASLAAATAQRAAVIKAGVDWLVAQGQIEVDFLKNDQVCFKPGSRQRSASLEGATARLRTQLAETAAYRRYFQRADKVSLIDQSPST